jgi:hypothetical protein
MRWETMVIFILCLILFLVAHIGMMKFIAMHMDKLRSDIFSSVISLMNSVSEGIKVGLSQQENLDPESNASTNGHQI